MTEKSFQIQPDTTLKSRIKNFYYKNKIKFYSTLVTLIILLSALSIYLENKDKKKFELSESYIKAKIFSINSKWFFHSALKSSGPPPAEFSFKKKPKKKLNKITKNKKNETLFLKLIIIY